MTGMRETCNHVPAAMFQVDAAVGTGLINPSCTSSVNEQLSCRKDIEPTNIKNLDFNREDFAQRCKNERSLVASSKKKINRLVNLDKKLLSLIDFASVLEETGSNSVLFTAVPKPKIDFLREIITEWAGKAHLEVKNIGSLIKSSKSKVDCLENLDYFQYKKLDKLTYAPEVSVAVKNGIYLGKVL